MPESDKHLISDLPGTRLVRLMTYMVHVPIKARWNAFPPSDLSSVSTKVPTMSEM
jgi:hypothetical protein